MNHDDTYKEIFDVVGDARDPAGIVRAPGVSPGYDLNKSAAGHPMIWYEVGGTKAPMTWDVFAFPDQPAWVQAMCARCVLSHPAERAGEFGLTIKADQKAFEYNATAEVPPFPGFTRSEMARLKRAGLPPGAGGRLTVEHPIECSRCGWKVRVVDNVARDTR